MLQKKPNESINPVLLLKPMQCSRHTPFDCNKKGISHRFCAYPFYLVLFLIISLITNFAKNRNNYTCKRVWHSNISKQVTLAASQGGHVAPNSPGRPISHSAAQIARSGFSMAVDFGRQERRPRRPESSRPLDLALDVSDLL